MQIGHPLLLFPLPLVLIYRAGQRLAKRKAWKEKLVKSGFAAPMNAMPPTAGTQFFEVCLSAQPVEGHRTFSAVRNGGPLVLGDLTRRCQIIQNGGLAVTNCRPNPEVSYRLRYTYSARNCVPAPESPPHTNVPNRTPPALLSAAAPPSNSGRGFQRGGTAVPPLCATRGYGGRVASPMFRVGV